MLTITVSQLNRYVKAVLEGDPKLSDLYIKGEISNFTHHYKSGHFYFSLKDRTGAVKAVMFRGNAEGLRFMPENGMAVLARASVGLYERDGAYQVYVTDLQPDGAGALAVAFEQRKEKLGALGWFDQAYKKKLPAYPQKIGIVTSQTGAALQDILHILERRYPLAQVVLYPATVQGQQAAATLIAGVKALDGACDVIVIGRGGGSAEDLWSFNDEGLARAVFEAETPIVSAVGHETDFTICDFVADVRAPTPSAAAELVSPSGDELRRKLRDYGEYLRRQGDFLLLRKQRQLKEMKNRPALASPRYSFEKKQEKLDFLSKALYNNKKVWLDGIAQRLSHKAALLDSLSPLRVLERGYSLTLLDGVPVNEGGQLQVGDEIQVRFGKGGALAQVTRIDAGGE